MQAKRDRMTAALSHRFATHRSKKNILPFLRIYRLVYQRYGTSLKGTVHDSNPIDWSNSADCFSRSSSCLFSVCNQTLQTASLRASSWLCKLETNMVASTWCFRSTEERAVIWLSVELKYQQPFTKPKLNCGLHFSLEKQKKKQACIALAIFGAIWHHCSPMDIVMRICISICIGGSESLPWQSYTFFHASDVVAALK